MKLTESKGRKKSLLCKSGCRLSSKWTRCKKKSNSLLANPMAKEFVVLNASGFESRSESRCQHEEEPQGELDSNKHYDTKSSFC